MLSECGEFRPPSVEAGEHDVQRNVHVEWKNTLQLDQGRQRVAHLWTVIETKLTQDSARDRGLISQPSSISKSFGPRCAANNMRY